MDQIAGVILDLDGLMLDTERVARRAWRRAAEHFGETIDDPLYDRIIGRTERDTGRILVRALGDDFPYDEARRRQQAIMDEIIETKGLEWKPGLADLLRTMETLDLAVAVATSSGRASARRKLSAAGLEGRFPILICGDEVTAGKPAPDIFVEAARRMTIPPRRCVVLEDSHAGAQAARAANMRVIVIPDLNPSAPETTEIAWKVLPSLEDAARFLAVECQKKVRNG